MHVLVEDYVDRRLCLFPHVGLRPKHHYLLHYASLTAKFGPLMHLWTMRFESKHSYFKRCIRYSRNFVNVCVALWQNDINSCKRIIQKAPFSRHPSPAAAQVLWS